jgi:Bacterial RNA polymerase, alpha chain C terminal domain
MLSVRTSNVLKNANIVYLGDLVTWTEAGLMGLQNCGRKSVAELREVLTVHGLRFGSSQAWGTPTLGEAALPKNLRDYEGQTQAKFFLRVSERQMNRWMLKVLERLLRK